MRVAECRNFNDFTGLMMLADRCSNKIIERVRTQRSGREQRSENHSRERNECFWHSGPRLEPVIVFHRYPTDLQLDARRASQIVMACREDNRVLGSAAFSAFRCGRFLILWKACHPSLLDCVGPQPALPATGKPGPDLLVHGCIT